MDSLTVEALQRMYEEVRAKAPPRMEICVGTGQTGIFTRILQQSLRASLEPTMTLPEAMGYNFGGTALPNLCGIPIVEHGFLPIGIGALVKWKETLLGLPVWNVKFILNWTTSELQVYKFI